jgi:hypothetical protein
MQMTCGVQFSHLRGILLALVTIAAHSQSVRADTSASSSTESDIAIIRNRLIDQYVAGTFSGAGRYLASQSADGSWTDINYAERSLRAATPSGWDPQKHLDRLKEMAVGYRNAKSHDLHSTKMRDGILRGLAFWYIKKPAADNWWSNEIGQQLALEPILILMADELPPKLLQVGTTYLHDPVQLASYKFTGQNLVWCATEQFVRGVLRGSADDITTAVRVMESVDVVRPRPKVSNTTTVSTSTARSFMSVATVSIFSTTRPPMLAWSPGPGSPTPLTKSKFFQTTCSTARG